jgi:hypothetical protein
LGVVVLKFKPGVEPVGIKGPTVLAIVALNDLFKQYRHDLTVTSVVDGTHGPKSYHRFGMAFDFRTLGIPKASLNGIVGLFKQSMPGWDIIIEKDHGHVEFDPPYPSG